MRFTFFIVLICIPMLSAGCAIYSKTSTNYAQAASPSSQEPETDAASTSADFVLQVGITRIGFVGSEVSQGALLTFVMEATTTLSTSNGKPIQTRNIQYKSAPHRLYSWVSATPNPSEWDSPEPIAGSRIHTIPQPMERELELSYDSMAERTLDDLLN